MPETLQQYLEQSTSDAVFKEKLIEWNTHNPNDLPLTDMPEQAQPEALFGRGYLGGAGQKATLRRAVPETLSSDKTSEYLEVGCSDDTQSSNPFAAAETTPAASTSAKPTVPPASAKPTLLTSEDDAGGDDVPVAEDDFYSGTASDTEEAGDAEKLLSSSKRLHTAKHVTLRRAKDEDAPSPVVRVAARRHERPQPGEAQLLALIKNGNIDRIEIFVNFYGYYYSANNFKLEIFLDKHSALIEKTSLKKEELREVFKVIGLAPKQSEALDKLEFDYVLASKESIASMVSRELFEQETASDEDVQTETREDQKILWLKEKRRTDLLQSIKSLTVSIRKLQNYIATDSGANQTVLLYDLRSVASSMHSFIKSILDQEEDWAHWWVNLREEGDFEYKEYYMSLARISAYIEAQKNLPYVPLFRVSATAAAVCWVGSVGMLGVAAGGIYLAIFTGLALALAVPGSITFPLIVMGLVAGTFAATFGLVQGLRLAAEPVRSARQHVKTAELDVVEKAGAYLEVGKAESPKPATWRENMGFNWHQIWAKDDTKKATEPKNAYAFKDARGNGHGNNNESEQAAAEGGGNGNDNDNHHADDYVHE